MTTAVVDPFVVPESYADLFEKYYTFVVRLVWRLGIDGQRAEDVASEILLRFYERDFLDKYDPDKVIYHDGERRPARFKSFLTGFVSVYVRGHRDRQALARYREPLSCDQPVGTGECWSDVFGPAVWDDYTRLEEAELVRLIKAHLVLLPPRSKNDICDLPRLFDLIVEQVRHTGRYQVTVLAAEFGISATAVRNWMKYLEAQVSLVVAEKWALFD